jgi:hypothetical protein
VEDVIFSILVICFYGSASWKSNFFRHVTADGADLGIRFDSELLNVGASEMNRREVIISASE